MSASQDSQELSDHVRSKTDITSTAKESHLIMQKKLVSSYTLQQNLEKNKSRIWLRGFKIEIKKYILNKNHPNYIKTSMKNALWEHKAKEIKKQPIEKWCANMQARFGKIKRTPSGYAKRQTITSLAIFYFYNDIIVTNQAQSTMGVKL